MKGVDLDKIYMFHFKKYLEGRRPQTLPTRVWARRCLRGAPELELTSLEMPFSLF